MQFHLTVPLLGCWKAATNQYSTSSSTAVLLTSNLWKLFPLMDRPQKRQVPTCQKSISQPASWRAASATGMRKQMCVEGQRVPPILLPIGSLRATAVPPNRVNTGNYNRVSWGEIRNGRCCMPVSFIKSLLVISTQIAQASLPSVGQRVISTIVTISPCSATPATQTC